MNVEEQARVFLAMMICGSCIGVIHDLLSPLRRSRNSAVLADLLLGICGAGGVISAGLLLGCDPFRLYTLLGVCAGWMIYAMTLGTIVRIFTRPFMKLLNKMTKQSKKAKNMQEIEN